MEVGLLQSFFVRTAIKDAFSGKEPALPVGKTIGQIIEDERSFQRSAAAEAKQESLRIAQARAEEEQQRAALREAVTITVFDKELDPGDYRSSMMCKVMIENRSDKDVRGFQGTIVFNDLFDDQIIRFELKEDDILQAGQTRRVTRYWNYNQFMDEHTLWAGTKLENMKVHWEPTTILFTDGTSMRAGEQ